MAIPSEIAKELTLDLSRIPTSRQEQAKQDVGEFVVNEILRSVSRGNSPVSGRGSFKKLDSEYADAKKGGNRTANLELEGDMLDSLEFETTAGGVKVGIFDSSEVAKADGHNNFSGQSNLPTRRFIPDASESFKRDISRGVSQILDRYRETPPSDPLSELNLAAAVLTDAEPNIDDVLAPFLGGLFE